MQLHGFNNLTKTLSFNIYDVCYARSERHQREYIEYIDEEYNAARLTGILRRVADIIGANVLNVAHQDYEPQGASVTMLISEGPVSAPLAAVNDGVVVPLPESVVAHLDKSHVTVHTYPESHPHEGVSSFRADIDVSTCGEISPLNALNFLIGEFESDVVTIDYRVRGFTRNVQGGKLFIDHAIKSISDFIDDDVVTDFEIEEINFPSENLFLTKMLRRNLELDDYLFGEGVDEFGAGQQAHIRSILDEELKAIFQGRLVER